MRHNTRAISRKAFAVVQVQLRRAPPKQQRKQLKESAKLKAVPYVPANVAPKPRKSPGSAGTKRCQQQSALAASVGPRPSLQQPVKGRLLCYALLALLAIKLPMTTEHDRVLAPLEEFCPSIDAWSNQASYFYAASQSQVSCLASQIAASTPPVLSDEQYILWLEHKREEQDKELAGLKAQNDFLQQTPPQDAYPSKATGTAHVMPTWKQSLMSALTPPMHPWEAAMYRFMYRSGVQLWQVTPGVLSVSGKATMYGIQGVSQFTRMAYHAGEQMSYSLWRLGSQVVPPVYRTVSDVVQRVESACAYLRSLEEAFGARLRVAESALSAAFVRSVHSSTSVAWSHARWAVPRVSITCMRVTPGVLSVSGKATMYGIQGVSQFTRMAYHAGEQMSYSLWRLGSQVVPPVYRTVSDVVQRVESACAYLRSLEEAFGARLRVAESALSAAFVRSTYSSTSVAWSHARWAVPRVCVASVRISARAYRVVGHSVRHAYKAMCPIVQRVEGACKYVRSLEEAFGARLRAAESAVSAALCRFVCRCTHAIWSFMCWAVPYVCVASLKVFARVSMALGHYVRHVPWSTLVSHMPLRWL